MLGSSFIKGALMKGKTFASAFSKGKNIRQMSSNLKNMFRAGGRLSALEKVVGPDNATSYVYNINRDIGMKAMKGGAAGAQRAASSLTRSKMIKGVGKAVGGMGHFGLKVMRTPAGKKASRVGFALGAVSMIGVHAMKGGMNTANEIVHERYMQDYMYSKSMLHNSRIGLASGTNSMLNKGGTQGLTLGLHKTRHGKY